MIIGVDAGMLGVTDKRLQVGVWRVAINLLRELVRKDRKNFYRLYSFQPIPSLLMQELGSRMKNVVLRPAWGWFSWRLPLELSVRPVEVFLGLGQALPSISARKIGFIYDLGFLAYPQLYPGSAEKLRRQTENLLRRADRLITISRQVRLEVVKRYHFPSGKIKVGYPGIDRVFSPTGEVYQAKNPYFLFVGALKPQKNLPLLLSAFSQFRAKAKQRVDLYLVGGDYWQDKRISREVLKSLKNIKLFGHIEDAKLAEIYRGAVALVVPSLVEGFCLPVVEAMASGTPVIATRVGPLPEIIGEAGILVEPDQAEAMAEAMRKMLEESNLRAKYQALGLAQAKKYSWEKFAETVYALFK